MDQISWQSSPFDFLHDDFFIDEILSRVDSAKSIVRLGMTSKKFHSLCSYPPVLKFKDVSDKNVGLIKYLDRIFESRMDSNIKYEFRELLMELSEDMDPPTILNFVTVHLLHWFQKALSLNVQELIFEFHGQPFSSYIHDERPELNLQNSMIPLKHLRVLILRNIPISINQSFGDWISNYCVTLEELGLYDVLVLPTRLTITSSSLRIFFIEGDFEELHVANAPKLEDLSVMWSYINLDKDELPPFIKISNSPNLKSFLLDNSDGWVGSLRYGYSDDTNKFPSLKCAQVLLGEDSLISSSSLERLLRDISQTRKLCVSDAVLHHISQEGMIQYANLFSVLRKLDVRIEGDEENKWWKNADTITPFAKSLPSLNIFKFTILYYYDLETPLEWLQNALSLDVWGLYFRFGDDDNNDITNMKSYDYLKVHVRMLTLKDIPIGLNHSFEDWVSTSCVDLRVLQLYGVVVLPSKFTIASLSLRAFTIDAHFMDLHVSAPKLMALRVRWNLASCDETHKTKNLSLKVSNSPDLKQLWVLNLLTSLPLEYYNSSDDKSSFPSLESSTVLIPEIHNNISYDSLMRLLVDTSQARKLMVSNSILHEISCSGILQSVNSIQTLEELQVRVEVNKKSRCWENAHQTILAFREKVHSLKTLKLTIIKNDNSDPLVSTTFRESLAENILKLGISSSLIYLDDHKVKIEVGPRDDEILLLQHIIKNAPPDLKCIFLYQD